MLARQTELRQKRRTGPMSARLEKMRDISDEPRPANGGSPDHHRIGTRKLEHPTGIAWPCTVAVDHHGYANRGFHGTHRSPIRPALVELAPGSPVNRNQADALGFRPPRQFRRIEAGFIPAKPHLHRDRDANGANGCSDQVDRMAEVAHERRARQAPRHALGRTTHVDVDEIGTVCLREPRRLRQILRSAPGNLHRMQSPAASSSPNLAFGFAARQTGGRHHFADRQRRSLFGSGSPHSGICDAGHWGEERAPAQQQGANPKISNKGSRGLTPVCCSRHLLERSEFIAHMGGATAPAQLNL